MVEIPRMKKPPPPHPLALNPRLLPTHTHTLTYTYTHTHPNLASLDQPARDNAAYRQYFGAMMPLFRSFEPTIHSIVEDPRANTAAVWCSSVSDTVVGRYANEYVLLLHFSPGGDKVERIVEFVDSAYSREFFGRLGRFVAERAGGQAQAQAAGGKEEEEGEEEQGAKKPS